MFLRAPLKYGPLGGTVMIAFLIMGMQSCKDLLTKKEEREPIARVGEAFLYKEDLDPLIGKGLSPGDSVAFVVNYINNWASKQLLLSKAKINLPEDKLAEYDALVEGYRTDLYTRAYKDALVQKGTDTLISKRQLQLFYERERENFKLKEKLVQLRFIQLPKPFLDKEGVIERLKRFSEEDVAYLDSIGIQFKKLNFNDSVWVPATRVISEIPPLTPERADRYLKKSQFFELEDSLGVYLAKINGVLNENQVAPLSYIEPRIKQVLLGRRRLEYIKRLETELIDEAIKENEFELYEPKE
ncbi:MAG: peptidyl-prolyl cis-trans isomerase [Flavobacteriaceae bacterium]